MLALGRRFLLGFVAFSMVAISARARADGWTKPTPEELAMTAEPAAPGADAIYLLRDERADDKLHVSITYIRLKILNEKGKDHADQEINYEGSKFNVFGVEGRTIHSDGTIIPFTGKPFQKLVERGGTEKYKATVFTLPDVQTGSILEYRYVIGYDSNLVVAPRWYLQMPLFVRKAHFQFVPSERIIQDGHGNTSQDRIAYSAYLPPGAAVAYSPAAKYYSLDVQNLAPLPQEDYMPPMHDIAFRALFYYTVARTEQEYWGNEGKYWSKDVDHFIDGNKLASVESQLVSASDTPLQKLQKIYGAVMLLENTSFTREHSAVENKEQGVRIKTAADVWQQKRGNSNELTRLFVGLARCAGMKAYVGFVTNRDRNLFVADYLDMSQLNDELAIVVVDGKEMFFDPGERYAAFNTLHWKHTSTQGIRQTDKGAALFETPVPDYKSSSESRNAFLEMDADGKVTGSIRIIYSGSRALGWREDALSTDSEELKRELEGKVQREMPPGIEVKALNFSGLTDWQHVLVATLSVTGSMGTSAGKRIFLPGSFFASTGQPLFVLGKRTMPIDLDYPYAIQDKVSIKLPPAFDLQTLPKDTQFSFPNNAFYEAKFTREAGTFKSVRTFVIGNVLFKAEEYPQLKDFYQKVNSKDREPAVLQFAQTAAGGSAPVAAGAVAAKP